MWTPISNRFLYGIALGAAIISLSGCGSPAHEVTENYVLIATNVKLSYWQSAGAGLVRSANQLHVKASLLGPETYDAKAQHEEFQRVLSQQQKPSGILVSPADPDLLKADIDAAIGQGIPVITLDSDAPASGRLMFIGTDNYKAGQMGAEVLVKQLSGKGNVAVYTMPGQANLQERLHGYKDVLANHPQIKITDTIDIKGDPRIAFDRTEQMVDKGLKADAFVCLEAIACPEIADVLDRKNITGKVIVAMDTDSRTLEWIRKGKIAATIAQKPYTMAFFGVKTLDELHHNKPNPLNRNWSQDPFSPIPAFVDTGATLVDKGNLESFVQQENQATRK